MIYPLMSPIQQAIVFELGVWALVFARMHLSLPDASKDLPGLYASDLKNNVCNFFERSLTKSRLATDGPELALDLEKVEGRMGHVYDNVKSPVVHTPCAF